MTPRSAALLFLLLATAAVALMDWERRDLADQLRIERKHRQDAEELARRRQEEMDGALETIHDLKREGDEPA